MSHATCLHSNWAAVCDVRRVDVLATLRWDGDIPRQIDQPELFFNEGVRPRAILKLCLQLLPLVQASMACVRSRYTKAAEMLTQRFQTMPNK